MAHRGHELSATTDWEKDESKRLTMTSNQKDWAISVGLNMTIIVFPFIVSLIYNDNIQEKTLTLTVAMFLMSVAIGSTEKILFYLFFIISFFLVATYGSISNEQYVVDIYHYQILLAFFGSIALMFDKYDLHVRKGQPLNHF